MEKEIKLTYADVETKSESGTLSYVSLTKLSGLKIVDVLGYIGRSDFDAVEAEFFVSHLVLENGQVIEVESEHDYYAVVLATHGVDIPNLDSDTLMAIEKTDPDYDADDWTPFEYDDERDDNYEEDDEDSLDDERDNDDENPDQDFGWNFPFGGV